MAISIDQLKTITEIKPLTILISPEELQKEYEELFKEKGMKEITEGMMEESIKPLLTCPEQELQNKFEELYSTFVDYSMVLSILTLKGLGLDRLYNLVERTGKMLETDAPSELRRPVEIVYDSSLLILKKVKELGRDGFLRRVKERSFEEYIEFNSYLSVSNYLLTACYSAKLGFEHNPKTLEILVDWLNTYIEELERYAVSFNISLTDEYYDTVKDFAL